MLFMPGHSRCRQQTGRPMSCVGVNRCAESFVSAVHEIGTGAAVDVDIDVSWHQIALVEVDPVMMAKVRKRSVKHIRYRRPLDQNVTVWKNAVRQDDISSGKNQEWIPPYRLRASRLEPVRVGWENTLVTSTLKSGNSLETASDPCLDDPWST